MKKRFISKPILISLLLFISILLNPLYTDSKYSRVDLPQTSSFRNTHPSIDYRLYKLLEKYKKEGTKSIDNLAAAAGCEYDNGFVEVEIIAASRISLNRSRQIPGTVEKFGGTVKGVYAGLYRCRVPLEYLDRIASELESCIIRPTTKPVIDQNMPQTSEGVAYTGADYWQNRAPYKSEKGKVKVAVLDPGFKFYEQLIGFEYPENITARTFRADGGWYDPNESRDLFAAHGTVMAEIICDMAPEVDLYLVCFSDFYEMIDAIYYCIDEDVDIISASFCYSLIGPGDGTGWSCFFEQEAANAGIIWVNAAGNSHTRSWTGKFYDPDGDGWHNFTEDDEFCEFESTRDHDYGIPLSWDDWGTWTDSGFAGSSQDYDLYLYYWNGSEWEYLESSQNVQSGYQLPTEYMSGRFPHDGKYAIAIKKINSNRNVRLNFTVYRSATSELEYYTGENLGGGADCKCSISVGAVDWQNDVIWYYSSRGPTLDGRIKPDISAPSHVTSTVAGSYGATGTSSATPHVAGAIALIRSKLPFIELDDIIKILSSRARDLGYPGSDNTYGAGVLYLR